MTEQTLSQRLLDRAKRLVNGAEKPDPTPVAIPIEMRRPESMDERIRRIIEHSMSRRAQQMGFETFQDADDFDIPDDPIDPTTPWETDFDAATAQAVEKGYVQKPDPMDPRRMEELRNKYGKNKKSKAPSEPPKEPPTEA